MSKSVKDNKSKGQRTLYASNITVQVDTLGKAINFFQNLYKNTNSQICDIKYRINSKQLYQKNKNKTRKKK